MAIVRFVRPWKARSNTITPGRRVATRAILTAFSTASAPELTSSVFVSLAPGHSSSSRRQTSMYGSYSPTMKHWCRERSICSWIAGAAKPCPVFWQPSPPAKSMYSRPSTSQMRAPSARATTSGVVAIPRGTYRSRSAATRSDAVCSVTAIALLERREHLARCTHPFGGPALHEALEVLGAMLAGEVDLVRRTLRRFLVATEGVVLPDLPVRVRRQQVRVEQRNGEGR